jgi:hypothetical protein
MRLKSSEAVTATGNTNGSLQTQNYNLEQGNNRQIIDVCVPVPLPLFRSVPQRPCLQIDQINVNCYYLSIQRPIHLIDDQQYNQFFKMFPTVRPSWQHKLMPAVSYTCAHIDGWLRSIQQRYEYQ